MLCLAHPLQLAQTLAPRVIRRAIRLMLFALLTAPALLQAQSIGVFADAAGMNPCIQAPPFSPITFYIVARPGGPVPGFTGVEFRVAGLVPNPPWFISIISPPIIDICMTGCPIFGAGAIMGFPSCMTTSMVLFTIQGFVAGTLPTMEWTVAAHDPPSSPSFDCPLMTLCDSPTFTRMCVNGERAYVNWPGECPTVAVESATWTSVRMLYAAP